MLAAADRLEGIQGSGVPGDQGVEEMPQGGQGLVFGGTVAGELVDKAAGQAGGDPEDTLYRGSYPSRKTTLEAEQLLLAEQEGAVPTSFTGSAAVVDHAVGDKRVVARDLPHLNVPLADIA